MRSRIENTQTFRNLSGMQQKIYMNKQVIDQITHQYTVVMNTSVEQWLNDFNPKGIYKSVILEMLEYDLMLEDK